MYIEEFAVDVRSITPYAGLPGIIKEMIEAEKMARILKTSFYSTTLLDSIYTVSRGAKVSSHNNPEGVLTYMS